MLKTTRAQREALFRIFQRDFPGWVKPTQRYAEGKPVSCPNCGHVIGGTTVKVPSLQWRSFRKRARSGPGCIMIAWRGMWLGIEPDGYTHS